MGLANFRRGQVDKLPKHAGAPEHLEDRHFPVLARVSRGNYSGKAQAGWGLDNLNRRATISN